MSEPIPDPIDGKYIFQVEKHMRVRFNSDGWVEEIGSGGEEDSLGTRLQGKAGTARDDLYARRYYDLYSRVLLIDIHPRISEAATGTEGLLRFRDLEPGSRIFDRVNRIIAIGNHHFNLNIKPLA